MTLETRSVCPRSVQWDPRLPGGERPRRRCLAGRLPPPAPHAPPPSSGCSGPGLAGMGMGRCERRGVAARCTPGVVVRARDPAGGGGQEQATALAAARARSAPSVSSLPPLPLRGPRPELTALLVPPGTPPSPAQALGPRGRCVPSRGSGSFRVIGGAGEQGSLAAQRSHTQPGAAPALPAPATGHRARPPRPGQLAVHAAARSDPLTRCPEFTLSFHLAPPRSPFSFTRPSSQ